MGLDDDNDGFISRINIDLEKLNSECMTILQDVLLLISKSDLKIDFKTFCHLVKIKDLDVKLIKFVFEDNTSSRINSPISICS
jgi:hypothetical protein